MKKKTVFLAIIIFLLAISSIFILGGCKRSADSSFDSSFDNLVITNLAVGKADCAVIQYKDSVGIIDTGTGEAYRTIASFLNENRISSIDYMILTHYDSDHIGSAAAILKNYDVKSVYLPDYVSEKKLYPELMAKVKGRDNVYFVNEIVSLQFHDLTMEIIPSDDPETLINDTDKPDNNMSLLTMMTLGQKRFFFTGDIEKARIKQMLDDSYDYSADWIKIPHHGAYQKKVMQLLSKVNPRYAVNSTSRAYPPDDELMDCLDEMGILDYDTMTENVITTCDGTNISVKTASGK